MTTPTPTPRLLVHPSAAALGIAAPVACIIDRVVVRAGPDPRLDDAVAAAAALAAAGRPLALPEAAGFAELFDRLGYPALVPAGRRLVEAIARKGFPRHNNIVDACNVMSVHACAGIGLHDAAALADDIVVERAAGGEAITPLFRARPATVRAGDLVYRTGDRLMAWLGARDVDAHDFRVVDETRAVVCIVLGNPRTDRAFNRGVCEGLFALLGRTCPDARLRFLDTAPAAA